MNANRVFSRFILYNFVSFYFFFHYIMLRISLNIIFSNRRRHNEYIFYQKKFFVEIVDSNFTFETIEKIYKIFKFFVRDVFFKIKNCENEIFVSRFNRSKMFFIRDKKYIFRIARRNSKIIYKNFMKKIETICNHNIIYRLLKKKNNQLNNQKTIFFDVRNNWQTIYMNVTIWKLKIWKLNQNYMIE